MIVIYCVLPLLLIRARVRKGVLRNKNNRKPLSRQPLNLTFEKTINADPANKLTDTINSISTRQRCCKSYSTRTAMRHILEQTGLRKSQDVTADLDNRIKKCRIQLENLFSH